MKTTLAARMAAIIVGVAAAGPTHGADTRKTHAVVDKYNLVWDSQSMDATGSMPLAGANFGLNVRVENDDQLFYIGHPDSRLENEKLIKLGRVRLTLSPSPFKQKFRQELDLAESCIRITGGHVSLKLWIDAFEPVVHVGMGPDVPVTAAVAYESWRLRHGRPAGNAAATPR